MKIVCKKEWLLGLFSFLIALFTTLLALACVAMGTLFSEGFLLQRMEETDYYENTATLLREKYAALGLPAGIEASFFDTAIDEAELYRNIREAAHAAYTGQPYTLDREGLQTRLYDQLTVYAAAQDTPLTEDVQTGLTYLSELCIGTYEKQANQALVRALGTFTRPYLLYLWVAIVMLAVLDGVCFRMLYCLCDLPHRAIRGWNSGLLGSALMLLAFPGWIYLSKATARLGITSISLKPLVMAYADHLFLAMIITGGVLVLAVLTVGIPAAHMVKKRDFI